MDPNTARARFEHGGFLVMLDTPAGLEFGIDLDTWETGPLFKGLKMIPPGIHYIHYSLGEVVVRRWSKENEDLLSFDSVSPEDVERVSMNIRDLDSGLGAYQLGEANDDKPPAYVRWQLLTEHITSELLQHVLPAHGCFSSATGSVYEDEEIASVRRMLERHARSMSDQGISAADVQAIIDSEAAASKDVESDDRFHFTHINIRHSFPKDATPEEIRRFSQDKSWLLRNILAQHQSRAHVLLGEFELSFLVILVGQNFTGIEHWKRILHLVLASIDILKDREVVETLIAPLLRILICQLRECPQEFVASVLEQDNFVAEILRSLVLNVYECRNEFAKQLLDSEIEHLRLLLAGFGWLLPKGSQLQEEADREEGEYAPQVVEL
ncbi:hypothetical protein H4R24_000604 [Coemansia sp. RSA 988]|nr:hypothetical protein H4R24_000604 [Coemansia sp. RSA 988]